MSYGFQVLNTGNQIIIDEFFENYEIYSTGSFYTVAATDPFNGGYQLSAPLGCILLISPDSYEPNVYYNAYYDSYAQRFLIGACSSGTLIPWGNLSRLVHFIVLKPITALTPVSGGYGLNVYKADGTLTYSSNHKSINFLTSVAITGTNGQTIVNSISPDKRCYVEISPLIWKYAYANGYSYYPYFWYEYEVYQGFRFVNSTTTVLSTFSSWGGETADNGTTTPLPNQFNILFAEY